MEPLAIPKSVARSSMRAEWNPLWANNCIARSRISSRLAAACVPGAVCVQRELTSTLPEDGGRPEPLRLESAQASIVLSALWPGSRFALGDDLTNLGAEPERLALVTNPDLLQILKLGWGAKPLDLMTYRPEDDSPVYSFFAKMIANP